MMATDIFAIILQDATSFDGFDARGLTAIPTKTVCLQGFCRRSISFYLIQSTIDHIWNVRQTKLLTEYRSEPLQAIGMAFITG